MTPLPTMEYLLQGDLARKGLIMGYTYLEDGDEYGLHCSLLPPNTMAAQFTVVSEVEEEFHHC